MAVLPMKKILICGMKRNRKRTLEYLQRQEAVEVTPGPEEDEVFQRMDVLSSKAVFERSAADAERALGVLQSYAPEKKGLLSSFAGRQPMELEQYEALTARREELTKRVSRILSLDKSVGEEKGKLPRLEQRLQQLEPWRDFDLPLNFRGTKKTAAFIGSLPGEHSGQALMQRLTELLEAQAEVLETGTQTAGAGTEAAGAEAARAAGGRVQAELSVVSADKEQTCFFVLCAKVDASRTEEALKAMGFVKAPPTDVIPAERKKQLLEEKEEALQRIEAAEQEIRKLAEGREELKFLSDYYTMRAEKYGVLNGLSQSRNVFVITGYVPARRAEALEQELSERCGVFAVCSDPDEDEDVPVLLSNNRFVEPVEGIVESYSLPGKGEMDPSTVMAPFYYLLFGLMLSDAAYGLIMVFGCLYCLKKFRNMEEGMRKTLTMFMYCGISTTFWGFLFGSFFGDAVNVIATTFFHRPDISLPPLWFEPVSLPMKMLVFSFVFGIVHLFTGLGVKLYASVKSGHPADGIYDVVFWYLLVGGAIVYMLTMSMFTEMLGLGFTLPPAVGTAAAVAALIGLVGIVLTSGRESKNWGKRLLKGLYGAYGVTSYLSDILSYSRLLALGLATSVISTVFNKMGSMLGDSIPGIILFILVFVIGHALNLAINAMGAYVHTNRLQFVEFFGKFYEGGGRKFNPFAEHTKYFKQEN